MTIPLPTTLGPIEQNALLSISTAIATVRHKDELLAVIRDQVQQLIPFYDTGILIVEPKGQYHYDLAVNVVDWDPSENNKQLHQAGLHRIPHPGSYVAHAMALMKAANGPILEDYQKRFDEFDYPFFPIMRQIGFQEAVGTALKSGGKVIGTFWLNSLEKGHFSEQQFSLFQAIADQVAVAVANILANEEILEREREKTLILGVSESTSAIRDKIDLLQTTNNKLQPIFKFDSTGLFIIDEAQNYHYDITVDYPEIDGAEGNQKLSEILKFYKIPHEGTAIAAVYAELNKTNSAVIFDFNDLFGTHPHPFADIILGSGFRETMAALLRVRGKPFGILFFNSKEKGFFREKDFRLFQAIADQLAVAVANILANEEILAREREKGQLLAISEAIAQVQNPKQLLRVIYETIKPVFPYDNAGLYVFDERGETCRELLDTDVLPDATQTQLEQANLLGPYPYNGHHPDVWIYTEAPAIYALADQSLLFPEGSKERIMFDMGVADGLKQMIGGPLYCGGRKIGLLSFNTRQEAFYTAGSIPLFKAITDQIAVAVANILANEEILERERELATLLNITGLFSRIRTRQELVELIEQHVQPLFGFNEMTQIMLLSDDRQWLDYFYNLPENEPRTQPTHTKFHPRVPCLGLFKTLFQKKEPFIWTIDEFIVEAAEDPVNQPLSDRMQSLGIEQIMISLLQNQGQVIGSFHVHSSTPGQFTNTMLPLFGAIADQLAVATANILANEEILEREREKDQLLGVSKALVTVRDKEGLRRILGDPLQALFRFANAVVVTSVGETYHQHLVAFTNPQVAEKVRLQKLPQEIILNEGSPYDWMMQVETARRIHLDELLAIAPADPGLHLMRDAGLTESFGSVLRQGGKPIGFLWFHYHQSALPSERQLPLFQAVADQFSVALANILANEEILERESEKTMQLTVSAALTSADEWGDKFSTVAQAIGNVVYWDICRFVFPQRAGLDLSWRRLPDAALEPLTSETVQRELGVMPLELRDLMNQITPLYAQPACYIGEGLTNLLQTYKLVRLMQEKWGIQSLLFRPISGTGEQVAVLILASRQPAFYQSTQADLLQRLAPQLALGLENYFSFEQLSKQEAEKTRQLALNEVLVSIKTSELLYTAIASELTGVAPFDSMSVWVTAEQKLVCSVEMTRQDNIFVNTTEQVRSTAPTLDELARQQVLDHSGQPVIYTGEAIDQQCARHPLYQIRRDQFGLRSIVELPLPMKEGHRALLALGSKTPYAFTEQDLSQWLLLIPPVALAIENLLAFEEIKALKKRVELEKTYLTEEIKTTHNFEEIIGVSPLLTDVFRQVGQVAPTDTTVLLTGESGTGKELIARAIHNRSPRRDNVLVKINCAALPANLIESELFGHERGAFTGAVDKRVGKFELANAGTIFLDEIGEMPLELQTKLLRVLQEKEYERLGSNKTLKADVRIIAATNRNLEQEVAEGRFRLDLFYRLSVFPIHLPPLRDRREDIPMLARYFAGKFSKKIGKPFRGIREQAMQELMLYRWPGNIRELENIIEQAVIINDGQSPLEWGRPLIRPGVPIVGNGASVANTEPGATATSPTISTIKQEKLMLERNHLLAVLKQTNGRIRGEGGAAQLLGVKPTTLEARINRLDLRREFALPGNESS